MKFNWRIRSNARIPTQLLLNQDGLNKLMLTKQLARFLAKHNVHVNAIALSQVKPDPMPTDPEALERTTKHLDYMSRTIPLGRNAEPEEITNSDLYLASDASSFVTGHVLVIDGGNIA